MANRKKNKLDIYAETRIWNLKLQNRNLTTGELMEEIITRFHLEGGVGLYPKLKKIILAARRRVMRRQTAMKKHIREWSSKLFLPEKAVAEWARNGLLTENNIEAVIEVLALFRGLTRNGRDPVSQ